MDKTLFLLSSSHHQAPLNIRERFSVNTTTVHTLCKQFKSLSGVDECILISTCNRVEIYGFGSACLSFRSALQQAFCEAQDIDPDSLEQYTIWKEDIEALTHLFEVASGLASQMLGETEILGQLKRTFTEAQTNNWVGPTLNRAFQKSFQAAKWVRTHTEIGSGQVSIGNIATSLALRIFENLEHCKILILGTGDIGEKTAQAFKNRGGHNLTISSRLYMNACTLAQKLGGDALPCDEALGALTAFDIIIGATSAQGTLLSYDKIKPLMKKRGPRPLFLVDLALPRDFDPQLDQLPNVYLYNLDDLGIIAQKNQQARQTEVERCKQALTEKALYVWEHLSAPVLPQ